MAEYQGVNGRHVVIHTRADNATLDPNHIYIATRDDRGTESLLVKLSPALALQVARELVGFAAAEVGRSG